MDQIKYFPFARKFHILEKIMMTGIFVWPLCLSFILSMDGVRKNEWLPVLAFFALGMLTVYAFLLIKLRIKSRYYVTADARGIGYLTGFMKWSDMEKIKVLNTVHLNAIGIQEKFSRELVFIDRRGKKLSIPFYQKNDLNESLQTELNKRNHIELMRIIGKYKDFEPNPLLKILEESEEVEKSSELEHTDKEMGYYAALFFLFGLIFTNLLLPWLWDLKEDTLKVIFITSLFSIIIFLWIERKRSYRDFKRVRDFLRRL